MFLEQFWLIAKLRKQVQRFPSASYPHPHLALPIGNIAPGAVRLLPRTHHTAHPITRSTVPVRAPSGCRTF